MKKIVDEFDRELYIDDTTQKLHSFSNRDKKIIYNAEIVENGIHTGFWTNYTEDGIVSDLEQKLKKWNNTLLYIYAKAVGFKSSETDPDKAVWNKFVSFVKEHEEDFFDKHGDFKKKFVITEEQIAAILKE